MHLVLEVPLDYQDKTRLDIYLVRAVKNVSRTKIQRAIQDGRVTVNGVFTQKSSWVVQQGDVICYRPQRPAPPEVTAEDLPLDIVYEDDHLMVVNKQAGMPVHPGAGNRTGTLVNALLHHVGCPAMYPEKSLPVGLSTAYALPSSPEDPAIRPGIVHRLDKDTSGLIVVAKDDETHRRLAQQFEQRSIKRRYLAIVWGIPRPATGIIDTPIGRDPKDRKKMTTGRGKQAISHFETMEELFSTALVQFRLRTGRTHQIRVHARHIGHPILGDPVYDGRRIHTGRNTVRRRTFFANLLQAMPRQALHAQTLGFVHPWIDTNIEFTSELPPDMVHTLQKLGAVEEKRGLN